MKPLDQACRMLADMLKGGPCPASEILAAAEGAGISERTAQRASGRLGVIKTRAEFRGGWTWALPDEGAKAESGVHEQCEAGCHPKETPRVAEASGKVSGGGDRARVIAERLRTLEACRGHSAPIHALDPRVRRWAAAGISDPDLREAYERAVYALRSGPVTAGYLDGFVAEVIDEGANAQP
jgi:hypothetical protein